MTKTLLKVSAIACLLGGFAFAGPAYVMAAEDMETEAVEEDLRPDVMAPGSQDEGAMPADEATEPAEEDVGEEEIEKDMGAPE